MCGIGLLDVDQKRVVGESAGRAWRVKRQEVRIAGPVDAVLEGRLWAKGTALRPLCSRDSVRLLP